MSCKYGIYRFICSIEGCYGDTHDRGYCLDHYNRITQCTYMGCKNEQVYNDNERRCYEHSVKGRGEFKIRNSLHHKEVPNQSKETTEAIEKILRIRSQ